jgi:periplasmic glucans biosynthesis protein
MDRRSFLHFATAAVGAAILPFAESARLFGAAPAVVAAPVVEPVGAVHRFSDVVGRARRLAESPFAPPEQVLLPPFADLDAPAFAAIETNPAARIPLGGAPATALEPLPPGHLFTEPVRLALVEDGRSRRLDFASRYFLHAGEPMPEPEQPAEGEPEMGFSGFRLVHALNRPDLLEEVLAFQGASHFRSRHRDGAFGASARGLALSTASPNGEEVPRFTHFWIHEAAEDEAATRIHALLDSPSVTGAFGFAFRPGDRTTLDVHCRLFPRSDVASIGIAPLSSMFFFGPESRGMIDDIRDAVHDSEGLQVITGRGERLWRPLGNPSELRLSGFVDESPQIFGLAQRNRTFAGFGDPEAAFERRPSVWVQPRSEWGPGQVVLVELPLPSEVNDNILAFWRPAEPMKAGGDYSFDYTVGWGPVVPDPEPFARVVETRSGAEGEASRRFAIDFDRSGLPAGPLEPRVSASQGLLSDISLIETPDPARVRATFRFAPGDVTQSELRLSLHDIAGDRASETWLYRWTRT